MLNFISVSFCTAYIIVAFRVGLRLGLNQMIPVRHSQGPPLPGSATPTVRLTLTTTLTLTLTLTLSLTLTLTPNPNPNPIPNPNPNPNPI